MGFDGNRSLRNLKFYFETEMLGQYKVSDLVGGLTPLGANTPWDGKFFKMGIFQKNSSVPLKRMVELYISVSAGGLTLPHPESKYPFEKVIFQDGYLSKELISISKMNG